MTLRRVAAAIAAGVIALGGLAACRMDPSVAVYVGDDTYTVAEVDEIYDEVAAGQADAPVTRALILETLVMRDLVKSLATEQGVEVQPVSPEVVAASEQVPPDSRYAAVRAEMVSYLQSWSGHIALVAPTEEQLREIYDRAVVAGEGWAIQPFEDLRAQLDDGRMRQAIGVRGQLADEVERVGVTVNPRFAPLEFVLLEFSGGAPALSVALSGPTSDAVKDAG